MTEIGLGGEICGDQCTVVFWALALCLHLKQAAGRKCFLCVYVTVALLAR